MINIEKSQIIHYGQSQTVTVYQDDKDTNTYYIVPVPRIAIASNGYPSFSLVEYKQNQKALGDDTGICGMCTLQIELYVDDEIRKAVRDALGANIVFGDFNWVGANATFTYEVDTMPLTQQEKGSLFGSNRVSFVIPLPTKDAVQSFVNAFGPNGSKGGTFSVDYQLSTYTALPPATVTVTFDANIAYSYEKTVTEHHNMWGHVTSRAVQVHQYLTQSQAGKVTVDPGGQPLTPETQKQLTDWGNTVLQNDVEKSIQQTIDVIGENNADTFSCSMMPSFTDIYVQDQVVPWIIQPTMTLPAFSDDEWKHVYSVVDERNLQTAFTVQNIGSNNVQSVTVTVIYPTAKTGNTHQFKQGDSGSWLFTAAGDTTSGVYDPNYKYTYTVEYTDGSAPYVSPQIPTDHTEIYINMRDLKPLEVTFDARNIPFAEGGGSTAVDRIEVAFYFVSDTDGDVLDVNFELNDQKTSYVVKSQSKLPSSNPYNYKCTYYLTDNTKVETDWVESNAEQQYLSAPLSTQMINLFPVGTFKMVDVMATYSDLTNNISHNHTWPIAGDQTPTPWTLTVPVNTPGFQVKYQGQYENESGQLTQIQPTTIGTPFITVSEKQDVASVTFDPSQIEWTNKAVTQVNLQVYTKTATGDKTNMGGTLFTPNGAKSFLWSFLYDHGKPAEYYWEASYWHKGQTAPVKTSAQKVEGDTIVVLFGDAPAG